MPFLQLALLQASLAALPAVSEPLDHLAQVRTVFLNSNVSILEAFLTSDQREAEAGNGHRLQWALHAFDTDDGRTDSVLQSWAVQSKGKWQPLLAQASRLAAQAETARGFGFASQTRGDQIERMRQINTQMRSRCQAALSIKADLCSCHSYLVNAAKMEGGDLASLTRVAFGVCPTDYGLEADYLEALTPRWGGSYDRIEKELAAARARGMSPYDMSRLRNLVRVAKAQDLRDAGRQDEAVAILTEGITSEPTPSVWRLRAARHKARGNPRGALSDANEAIRSSKGGWLVTPWNLAELLYTRAWALNEMSRTEEAKGDIRTALRADARHSGVLKVADAWGIPRR